MSRLAKASIVAVCLVIASACSKDPKVETARHLTRGNDYFQHQQNREAIVEYLSALSFGEPGGEIRLKLADAYLAAGDAPDALREYARAADLLPENADLQVKTGVLMLMGSKFTEAQTRAQAVLAKDPNNLPARILLGRALAGLGDFDSAVRQLEDVIETDPTRGLSYMNLASIQIAKGKIESAEAVLKKAVEVAPDSVDAYMALGDLYWSAGRREEAEHAYSHVLMLDPKNLQANRRLAMFYLYTARPSEAEAFIRTVSEVGKGAERVALADYYFADNRQPQGLQVLQTLAKAGGDGAIEAQIRLAGLDLDRGRGDDALQATEAILKKVPTNAEALVLKARILVAKGDLKGALAAIQSADRATPGSAGTLIVLGHINRALGDQDAAIKAYNDALKANPYATLALFELANLMFERGGAKAAVQFADEAVQRAPNDPAARLILAQALTRSGLFTRAEAELRKLEVANPKAPAVQLQIGQLYLAKGDFDGATRAFNRALAIDDTSFDGLAGLVAVDVLSKRSGQARARVEAQLAKAPDNPDLLMLAARVYQVSLDDARAEPVLRKLIATQPNNLDAYRMLGQTLARGGKLNQAHAEFAALSKKDPKQVGPRTAMAMIAELQQKLDEAQKGYQDALEVDPKAPIAANNLAWLYAERGGDLNDALKWALVASAQLPDRPEIRDTLGWVSCKRNQAQLAIPHLKASTARSGQPHLSLSSRPRPGEDGRSQGGARRTAGGVQGEAGF